ncbi:MAG: hypothetical protein MUE60_01190 [Candidatus Eisenbacteria bacterium]|jgi:hypothetical protein|nr:hypothetical protein [Candidatus Eisenbacteria bacterium]
MAIQKCPICLATVTPNPRYPRFLCRQCATRATSVDGRQLEFANTDFTGGFAASYADSGEEYPSHECYVDGVRCHADEARFGGIVIEAVAEARVPHPER